MLEIVAQGNNFKVIIGAIGAKFGAISAKFGANGAKFGATLVSSVSIGIIGIMTLVSMIPFRLT